MISESYYNDRIKKSNDEIDKIDKEVRRIQGEIRKAQSYLQQLVNKKISLLGKIEGFKEILSDFKAEKDSSKNTKEIPKKIASKK